MFAIYTVVITSTILVSAYLVIDTYYYVMSSF